MLDSYAVWDDHGLVGFVNWDTAGPSTREVDLAYTAGTGYRCIPWHLAEAQGFTNHDDWPRRLHLLLDAYRYTGDRGATIARRARINAAAIHRPDAPGNPTYAAMLPAVTDLENAAQDIDGLPAAFWQPPITKPPADAAAARSNVAANTATTARGHGQHATSSGDWKAEDSC